MQDVVNLCLGRVTHDQRFETFSVVSVFMRLELGF